MVPPLYLDIVLSTAVAHMNAYLIMYIHEALHDADPVVNE